MVAMSSPSSAGNAPTTSPVEFVHSVIQQNPDQSVPSILSTLHPPPLSTIPDISSPRAAVGNWVQFTGLVQDVWDTEIFMATCNTGHSALLTEHVSGAAVSPSEEGVKLGERLPIYMVSIPGQTNWSLGLNRPNVPIPTPTSNGNGVANGNRNGGGSSKLKKRSRDDVDMEEDESNVQQLQQQLQPPQPVTPSASKPPVLPKPSSSTANGSNLGTDKRSRSSSLYNHQSSSTTPSSSVAAATSSLSTLGLNTPDSGSGNRLSTAIVAKLYTPPTDVNNNNNNTNNSNNNDDSLTNANATPKLNAVIQVIGILQDGNDLSSEVSNDKDSKDNTIGNEDLEFETEVLARNPKNVKRLHVVQWRSVPSFESNPYLRQVKDIEAARKEASTAMTAGKLREEIIQRFSEVLYGDKISSEYLLMCLLSKPIETSSQQQVLGKLSINLILPNDNNKQHKNIEIIKLIKEIYTKVIKIDVNITSMNCTDVYAKKDYNLNRLKAGKLQYSKNSLLVLDECSLSNGRLSERGIKNVRALKMVSDTGYSPVDFQYYQSNVFMGCNTLILSKGSKSILGGDLTIRIKDNNTSNGNVSNSHHWNEELLKQIRCAVSLLTYHNDSNDVEDNTEFDISPDTSDEIAKFYVEERQQGRAKDGQDCLSGWLNIARCCAHSFGETGLSVDRWKYVLNLEKLREEQNKTTTTSSQ